PFMRLPDGQSLLQKALLRAVSIPGVREVLTVTGQEHYFSTKNEYAATGLPEGLELTYVVEPLRRNTAPAIALAALQVAQRHGPEAVMLVLSS
ncbi:sugar phosphate nucleotidyltransferase, partial [Escherichia coli]|nr:sugar phosphate nucleotidyltransferase [Escherichia coli]